MNLSFEQIKNITTGAVRIVNGDNGISFLRFTEEQENAYKTRSENFWKRSFCTAGIKLLFRTNSRKLLIKTFALSGIARNFFSFDVFVDGKLVGYLDNFSHAELPKDYVDSDFESGEFLKTFELGSGEKTVCVHFPWSVQAVLREFSVDDNAFIEAIKPCKKLLAFGDSITQGYDALRPSNRYIAKLADYLGAEEINKAIGGDRFFPELANLPDAFTPDYITVAYGTNDWNSIERDIFKNNCTKFFNALSKNYPKTKIFVITPIWRANLNAPRPYGDFKNLYNDIVDATIPHRNITVINGFEFVPKDISLFSDSVLHPNDNGFNFYYSNLIDKIAKYTSIK